MPSARLSTRLSAAATPVSLSCSALNGLRDQHTALLQGKNALVICDRVSSSRQYVLLFLSYRMRVCTASSAAASLAVIEHVIQGREVTFVQRVETDLNQTTAPAASVEPVAPIVQLTRHQQDVSAFLASLTMNELPMSAPDSQSSAVITAEASRSCRSDLPSISSAVIQQFDLVLIDTGDSSSREQNDVSTLELALSEQVRSSVLCLVCTCRREDRERARQTARRWAAAGARPNRITTEQSPMSELGLDPPTPIGRRACRASSLTIRTSWTYWAKFLT